MKKKIHKIIAVFLAINLLFDAIYPTAALALTGGPSQPEMEAFTPIGTSDMVNVSSGDFNYNIPLLDVGGYPLNISYQSGITMDQEASWVGLGWTLNPGAITRNMRSLPDDFEGDEVEKQFSIMPNTTYGVKFYPDAELFGVNLMKTLKVTAKFGMGLSYNNYNGYGFSVSLDFASSSMSANKGNSTAKLGLSLSAGSESGVGINPTVSFSQNVNKKENRESTLGASIGLPFNSRAGLQALTIDASRTKTSSSIKAKATKQMESGTSISFATPSYTPQISHSMLNTNLSLSVTLGGEIFGGHLEGRLMGSFSGQTLLKNTELLPAYGYMNIHQGASKDKVMLDFNREKDGGFSDKTPALPLTNFTYDVYSVAGQGIGGVYRAHRSDIGVLFDSKATNISAGIDIGGFEVGVGATAHPGVNFSVNESDSKSGKWEDNNGIAESLPFKGSSEADPLYEPYYFQQAGELTSESDPDFFDGIGGFYAVRVGLDSTTENTSALKKYVIGNGFKPVGPSSRARRARRNEVISLMDAREAQKYGDISKIESFTVNDFTVKDKSQYKAIFEPSSIEDRVTNSRKSHHTSQITTYRSDGARYVYGIPAYNKRQEDVSFAVEGHADSKGLIQYNHGASDDMLGNKKGMDHFFDKTILPAYAHSYLLTAVLSVDYVDLTGNGPTEDDLGTYTKFNYSKIDNYKWRVPFEKANYNEGLKTLEGEKGDDKANYIYGEKEIWYVHSIETKNYIAEFTLTDRKDAFGVGSNQGGLEDEVPLKKLSEVTLYSRQDLLTSMKNGTDPTPVKTVHFEYDYSLCGDVNNNSGEEEWIGLEDLNAAKGKLTLKSIYFTYGKSAKGKLSPYKFTYASSNPGYDMKEYDRWGNYKPNPTTGGMTTSEYPYVEQSAATNGYASAWHMTAVDLPSGGVINIEYEADDYAYVQDKRAMEMFTITGASEDKPTSPSSATSKLYNDLLGMRNYLIFKLQGDGHEFTTDEQVAKAYFREKDGTFMKNLYFKFLLDLGRRLSPGKKEYVSGYVGIKSCGLVASPDGNGHKYGWVQLEEVTINDAIPRPPEKVNPISQAGWNFTKLYLPQLAYQKPAPDDPGVVQILESIVSTAKSIKTLVMGFYNQFRIDGMAQDFDALKSFVRLYNPSNAKKGGGSRVHKISMSDNWNAMTQDTNTPTSFYGQEYDYTTTDEYGAKISSGVASYEPTLGGDENPFREPVSFEQKHLLAGSEDFFQEKPYGESFFPGASVIYGKVTTSNLKYENVKRNATGKIVNEFYTTKDFPTITIQTAVKSIRKKPNPLLKFLKVKCRDFKTVSQGFVIETNDMAGKPKATWVYQEGKENPISGVEYKYKASQQPVSIPSADKPIQVGSLDNNVLVMEKNGTVAKKMVGVTYDFINDMREQKTTSRSGGLGGNLDAFLVGIFPALIPIVLPSYSQERVRFRSAVVTKVINRTGILEETIVHDEGSIVSTKNILLDAEDGEVLLTETKNQFDDPLYNFTYPAYWAYDKMGPAYKNIDAVFTQAGLYLYRNELVEGDEVAVMDLYGNTLLEKAWVKSVSWPVKVIDRNGYESNLMGKALKVLRSGRRNQQNLSVGSFTSLYSPLKDNNADGVADEFVVNSGLGILNATASEFSDQWKLFCECSVGLEGAFNPYVQGIAGNWRPLKAVVYLTDRTMNRLNDNTNVRKDGTYVSFNPFWSAAGGSVEHPASWTKNASNWQHTSEVTLYSPYGFELENKDALGRFSSAIYGYNNTMPTAVSANAEYREIAFDGFEDYGMDNCPKDHFSYESVAPTNVSNTKSHTGRKSIAVPAGQTIQIRKVLDVCPE